jgi:hypothetical protein
MQIKMRNKIHYFYISITANKKEQIQFLKRCVSIPYNTG